MSYGSILHILLYTLTKPSLLPSRPVGMPKMEKVYLHNPSSEEISLISISATTAHFHASFFQNRVSSCHFKTFETTFILCACVLLLCVSKLIAFNLENEFSVLTLCLSVLSFCVSSYTRVRLHGWMVVHSKHTGARIDLWLSWSVFTDWLSLVMWCSATYGSSEEFLMCLFLSLFFFKL